MERRKALKLTQAQLGKLVGGVGKAAVGHWELGRTLPVGHRWNQLTRALQTNSHYLLTGQYTPPAGQGTDPSSVVMLPEGTTEDVIGIAKGTLMLADLKQRKPAMSEGESADDKLYWTVNDAAVQFPKGSDIIIHFTVQPEPGDYVLVALLGDNPNSALFRRYRPAATSKPGKPPYTLCADNKDYEPRVITRKDKPVLLGTAVRAVSKLR